MQDSALFCDEAPFRLAITVVDGFGGHASPVEHANARATYWTGARTLTVPIDVGGSHPNLRLLVEAPQHRQEIDSVSYNGIGLRADYWNIEEPELIWCAEDRDLPTCGGSLDLVVAFRSLHDRRLLSDQFGSLSLFERVLVERKLSDVDALGVDKKPQLDNEDLAPPVSGELILYHVLPPRYRDPVIGDLAEIHRDAVAKFGVRRANRIYWCQLVGAIVRLVPQKVWLAIAGVAAWLLGKG